MEGKRHPCSAANKAEEAQTLRQQGEDELTSSEAIPKVYFRLSTTFMTEPA